MSWSTTSPPQPITGKWAYPIGVGLIAGFELFKAGILIWFVAAVRNLHQHSPAGPAVRLLLSLASDHIVTASSHLGAGSYALGVLFPIYAAFNVALGIGLLALQKWARWILVASSGIYVIRFAEGLLVRVWALGDPALTSQAYLALAITNLIVVLVLLSANEAFRAGRA